MEEMRQIPVSVLEKLEKDRLAIYEFVEHLVPKLALKDVVTLTNITQTMWEVSHRKVW